MVGSALASASFASSSAAGWVLGGVCVSVWAVSEWCGFLMPLLWLSVSAWVGVVLWLRDWSLVSCVSFSCLGSVLRGVVVLARVLGCAGLWVCVVGAWCVYPRLLL